MTDTENNTKTCTCHLNFGRCQNRSRLSARRQIMLLGLLTKADKVCRLCAGHMDRRIFMRWNLHRIEMIRQNYVPKHTAYAKTFRRPPLCISRKKYREWRTQPEEPSPVRAVLQSRSLNAYQVADYSQSCEIGRLFCFSGHFARCRSPPSKSNLVAPHMNLFG